MKTMTIIKVSAALVIVCSVAFLIYLKFSGRSVSRYVGQTARQVIKIPEMQAMVGNVNMWFDEKNNATVKDITYCSTDGYYYTTEFRNVSPFEGVIRWVPTTQRSDIIQSRMLSRWSIDIVNLKVPENFQTMYGVSIVGKGKERIKNMTYFSRDGKVYTKEYREGLVDRFFGGYLEVRGGPVITPPVTECDKTYVEE